MSVLNVQPVSADSVLPTYSQSENYVLYANEDTHLLAGRVAKVSAGFRLSFPPSHCALITNYYPNVRMLGGLVDSDYRGEVAAICMPAADMLVKRGEPIAKMILLEIATPEIEDGSAYMDMKLDELV
ncbi:dUTP pyrophosphatase [Pancytospora philotis]|nr:dUTP pyrophosphatase [Pancytospora philotis]